MVILGYAINTVSVLSAKVLPTSGRVCRQTNKLRTAFVRQFQTYWRHDATRRIFLFCPYLARWWKNIIKRNLKLLVCCGLYDIIYVVIAVMLFSSVHFASFEFFDFWGGFFIGCCYCCCLAFICLLLSVLREKF